MSDVTHQDQPSPGEALVDPVGRRWMSAVELPLSRFRDYGIVASFAVLIIYLSFRSDAFLTSSNLGNVFTQQTPLLIVAGAGTLVIVAGGFDLSVGATFALSGVVGAKVSVTHDPLIAVLCGVGVGFVVGVANGLVTTAGRVNSLIGTLASSYVVSGIALLITGGLVITVDSKGYVDMGQASWLGVNVSVVIGVGVLVLLGLLLKLTVYGRHVYAVGDNAEAAKLAGVRTGLVKGSTFVVSGLCAGLAGVLASAQYASGQSDTGGALAFAAIAAIVVGGTSIQGGEGAVWRSVVGVLFIAVIGNGFTLLAINTIYQEIVQGVIILGAVGLDAWTRVRRS